MTPAIGARTMGNSVLKSSISRRSGHMVCSLQVKRGFGAGIVAEASEILALHDADKLCIQAPPDAPAPQRDRCPNSPDKSKRPKIRRPSPARKRRQTRGRTNG